MLVLAPHNETAAQVIGAHQTGQQQHGGDFHRQYIGTKQFNGYSFGMSNNKNLIV